MKFFVPSAFEKSSDTIKFKATQQKGPNSAGKAKKNKKKNKKKATATNDEANKFHGNGPLAPTTMDDDDETMTEVRKVKKGKVEKTKTKLQKQQRQLKATPSLIKSAVLHLPENSSEEAASIQTSNTAGNSFQAKLKEQLMGGRFRFLNEQLYTMDSKKAQDLFKHDPQAFKAYHDGYRHQVEKWPLNPLDRIIKMIKKLPKSLEVGDFGCGEGKLAKSVPHKVYSMDLVSCRNDIIACDMASTPLKSHTLDVAVYCLSLMGTNLKDYLLEANRVLKVDGFMYVAEIQSRFESTKEFVKKVDSFGFQLVKQDVGQQVFYFFQFKKIRNIGKVANVPQLSLKPCLYRKR